MNPVAENYWDLSGEVQMNPIKDQIVMGNSWYADKRGQEPGSRGMQYKVSNESV